jgi:hypothetical protein
MKHKTQDVMFQDLTPSCVTQDQVNRARLSRPLTNGLGDLGKDIGIRIVEDGMDRIEPQAVEVIFLKPIERIMDKEIPHHTAARPIEVDRTPQGVWRC